MPVYNNICPLRLNGASEPVPGRGHTWCGPDDLVVLLHADGGLRQGGPPPGLTVLMVLLAQTVQGVRVGAASIYTQTGY